MAPMEVGSLLTSTTTVLIPSQQFCWISGPSAIAVLIRLTRLFNRSQAVIDMTDAQKTLRIAEVRFLRAFYYFYLVQTFGTSI